MPSRNSVTNAPYKQASSVRLVRRISSLLVITFGKRRGRKMSDDIGRHSDYTITITPTMNRGFIVRIGCGEFVFQNHKALLAGLRKYLDDPEKYIKLYTMKSAGSIMRQPSEQGRRLNFDQVVEAASQAYRNTNQGQLAPVAPPSEESPYP
jgi:hypothetical protein